MWVKQAEINATRNVVALCDPPDGKPGRTSKSLTFEAAQAVLNAAQGTRLHAYVVLSLLIGARTEELRALMWSLVDLTGKPNATPPIPAVIQVWRSVREGGDAKTKKSRAHPRATSALHRRADHSPPASERRPANSRPPLAGQRSSLRLRTRYRAGRG
ncbi:integrase [Catenuloplanes nepalensis]|uniref:Integrase n=1 Tax=Catenuloplanes nepalensis TaxID=587533 RepID=A0ABT9MZJ5_9ACTN|nr:integrase [Catenuloplanes nepalensis]